MVHCFVASATQPKFGSSNQDPIKETIQIHIYVTIDTNFVALTRKTCFPAFRWLLGSPSSSSQYHDIDRADVQLFSMKVSTTALSHHTQRKDFTTNITQKKDNKFLFS